MNTLQNKVLLVIIPSEQQNIMIGSYFGNKRLIQNFYRLYDRKEYITYLLGMDINLYYYDQYGEKAAKYTDAEVAEYYKNTPNRVFETRLAGDMLLQTLSASDLPLVSFINEGDVDET